MTNYKYIFPDESERYSGTSFSLNNVAYPGNWLGLATDEDLSARGITRVEIVPPVFEPTPDDIVALQSKMTARAFAYMYNVVLENASVNAISSYANTTYTYGVDKVTRENINGTVTTMIAGITYPNPLPWTPKGCIEPINLSHADLVTASGAILLKVNELYGVYFVHKANILMSDDWNYLTSYDYTTGYANT